MSPIRELGESAANAVLDRIGRGVSRMQERKPLAGDVLESDDAYLVVFDAPGATRSDVQVRFVDGAVEVRIDRFRDFFEDFEMRFPGRGLSLSGRVDLPDGDVNADAATATLAGNGTLRVHVPKSGGRGTDLDVADEDDATSDSTALSENGEDGDLDDIDA